jgi:ketosteroid isomerase-like protein
MVDEQQIAALEHQSHEAILRGDATVLDRLLADDCVFSGADGRVLTKAEWIAELLSSNPAFEAFDLEDLQVRVYGDTAVTVGRVTVEGCSTATYVKRGARWQMVAEQTALLSR